MTLESHNLIAYFAKTVPDTFNWGCHETANEKGVPQVEETSEERRGAAAMISGPTCMKLTASVRSQEGQSNQRIRNGLLMIESYVISLVPRMI